MKGNFKVGLYFELPFQMNRSKATAMGLTLSKIDKHSDNWWYTESLHGIVEVQVKKKHGTLNTWDWTYSERETVRKALYKPLTASVWERLIPYADNDFAGVSVNCEHCNKQLTSSRHLYKMLIPRYKPAKESALLDDVISIFNGKIEDEPFPIAKEYILCRDCVPENWYACPECQYCHLRNKDGSVPQCWRN